MRYKALEQGYQTSLSNKAIKQGYQKAINEGMNDYLAKPVELAAIIEVISKYLARV
jgi:CheY-like chemotaxis protein